MFTFLNRKIARFILVASVALIATGVPFIEIAQAADCLAGSTCTG